MENNVTSGNILKHIAFFAIPYLLSYFLQTLYGMADLFIIGQFHAYVDSDSCRTGYGGYCFY